MSRLKDFLQRTYQPKIAPWKRPVLLGLSVIFAVLTIVAAWTQLQHHWTNEGVWLVIAMFAVMSVAGIGVAIFGDDWWVALMLGGI